MVEFNQPLTVIGIEQSEDSSAIEALVCETEEGETVRFTAAGNLIYVVDEFDD